MRYAPSVRSFLAAARCFHSPEPRCWRRVTRCAPRSSASRPFRRTQKRAIAFRSTARITSAQPPSWVRVRAVVAFEPLREAPGWQELRARFSDPLTQEPIRGQICQLTDIPESATWRQRGTHRRSWLQADLAVDDAASPAASAILFLPEEETEPGFSADARVPLRPVGRTAGNGPTGLGRNSTAQASGSG